MKKILGRSLIALATLASAAPVANAGLIPVINAGFEDPVIATPGGFTTTIPGFTISGGGAGVLRPTTAMFVGGAPEGQNTAYSNGGTIDQVLSSNLAVGTYTLQVDVGKRLDFSLFPGYSVQLLAGGTLLAQDNNTLNPTAGTFLTSTVIYTALLSDPNLGRALEIRLSSGNAQTNFDDVRLNFNGVTAVPEPTTLALAGTGAVVLLGYGWRRRGATV